MQAHAGGRDGRSYQCGDPSHKKQPIAKGGLAVLTERLTFMATVARFEANTDMSVVTTEGEVQRPSQLLRHVVNPVDDSLNEPDGFPN